MTFSIISNSFAGNIQQNNSWYILGNKLKNSRNFRGFLQFNLLRIVLKFPTES